MSRKKKCIRKRWFPCCTACEQLFSYTFLAIAPSSRLTFKQMASAALWAFQRHLTLARIKLQRIRPSRSEPPAKPLFIFRCSEYRQHRQHLTLVVVEGMTQVVGGGTTSWALTSPLQRRKFWSSFPCKQRQKTEQKRHCHCQHWMLALQIWKTLQSANLGWDKSSCQVFLPTGTAVRKTLQNCLLWKHFQIGWTLHGAYGETLNCNTEVSAL